MQAAPLLEWSEPVTQFVGFVASFLATGAIGFRYAAVRDRLGRADVDAAERTVYARATQRAAVLGLIGAGVELLLAFMQLPSAAARAHVSVGALVTTDLQTIAQLILLALAIAGLVLAARSRWSGWPIAAAGVIGELFVVVLSGRWSRLVNPVHRLAGGLWIGTLFVLVVAGLGTVLRDDASRERRGVITAAMVNGRHSGPRPMAMPC
ncbi:MAG: hypothetical protein M3081_15020 [Gemmatimonadota bacterium]|nr:hypothetical protein [Gemmatimonadota bacterium]